MSKHTPGPWKIAESRTHHGWVLMGEKPFVDAVAGTYVGIYSAEIQKANANLIAAAPEMFEELELLIEQCIEVREYKYADGSPYEEEEARAYGCQVKRIREILAKARGEK